MVFNDLSGRRTENKSKIPIFVLTKQMMVCSTNRNLHFKSRWAESRDVNLQKPNHFSGKKIVHSLKPNGKRKCCSWALLLHRAWLSFGGWWALRSGTACPSCHLCLFGYSASPRHQISITPLFFTAWVEIRKPLISSKGPLSAVLPPRGQTLPIGGTSLSTHACNRALMLWIVQQ